jgi:hypothetical protein
MQFLQFKVGMHRHALSLHGGQALGQTAPKLTSRNPAACILLHRTLGMDKRTTTDFVIGIALLALSLLGAWVTRTALDQTEGIAGNVAATVDNNLISNRLAE